jgi:pyruvate/2-oxoglutarate dehydrogenase complex dihydrolipoamide acyltransferase (E2) component
VITRNVIFAAVGEVHDSPKVVDDKLEVRPCVFINFTVDHRFLDGGRTKNLNKTVKFNYFNNK